MIRKRVGVLGASSLVGESLLLLDDCDSEFVAFTRKALNEIRESTRWRQLSTPLEVFEEEVIERWVCCAPIWALPDYFEMLKKYGAKRIVAISSTSRFTKSDSTDTQEHEVVTSIIHGETCLTTWAAENNIEWVILRPTLIYGRGRDKNISEIVRFIQRFGFFPLLSDAKGLRQPIHAEDVASACMTCLYAETTTNRAYNLSGGETLPYREMVIRIFHAMGRRPMLITLPLWVFKLVVAFMRLFPRCRHWSAAMAERMNQDLVFSHSEATQDFAFKPWAFRVNSQDL